MNERSLSHVGLTLIGVYALTQALVLFPGLVATAGALAGVEAGRVFVNLVIIAPFGVLILLGCLLVTRPELIARRLPPPSDSSLAPQVGADLTTSLFATAGLLIFASAMPELLGLTAVLSGGQHPTVPWLASHLGRAAFGLFLFFRPAVIVTFWLGSQGGNERAQGGGPAA